MIINKPSKDEIKRVFKLWNETREFKNYSVEDEVLQRLFRACPKNENLHKIIVKITCLDTFYSTNATKYVKIHEIAEKILRLNFDERVRDWDELLVEELAKFKNANFRSFASKYCAWHNWYVYERNDYVIYDSIVRKKLAHFNEHYPFAKFSENGLKKGSYANYKAILEQFRDKFELGCKFRDLDWYLWRLGKLERLEKSRVRV